MYVFVTMILDTQTKQNDLPSVSGTHGHRLAEDETFDSFGTSRELQYFSYSDKNVSTGSVWFSWSSGDMMKSTGYLSPILTIVTTRKIDSWNATKDARTDFRPHRRHISYHRLSVIIICSITQHCSASFRSRTLPVYLIHVLSDKFTGVPPVDIRISM